MSGNTELTSERPTREDFDRVYAGFERAKLDVYENMNMSSHPIIWIDEELIDEMSSFNGRATDL